MTKETRFKDLNEYAQAMAKVNASAPPQKSRVAQSTLDSTLKKLHEDGYVIVEGLLTQAETRALRDDVLKLMGGSGRNSFEGFKTQRVYGLLGRTLNCNPLIEHPLVLDLLDRLLLPNYLLSQLVAINILEGEQPQLLHHDDALYPVPRPRRALSAATIWALDDFTRLNGATVVIPGSHRWEDRPATPEELKTAISVVMPAGSMVFFLGTLWHGGGANATQNSRLAVTAQYCEPWCRTVENYSLSTPAELARKCSPDIQRMLGYSIHSALMGYVDGRHPKHLLETPER